MKNRKGFTLVELLAAIVILGILMVFSIPIITGMLDRSKNKIYVDDAKKMISRAEYQMRSSSNEIEVPDPGNCIVISLVYLDNGSFSNPPNGGSYIKDSSFVVVKNKGGNLEYSAMIVENVKGGGYKGVKLSTNTQLYGSNSLSRVTTFKNSELKIVEDSTKDVDTNYINEYLGNGYVSGIDHKYNYPKGNSGNAVVADNFVPKITKASIDHVKSFNSLEATLSLTVVDDDTAKSDLTVYIAYNDDGFKEINATPYGDKEQFTKNINFKDLGYDYVNGGPVSIYVIVKDKDGNTARKALEYKIQKNKNPEINNEESSITKLPSDSKNMTKALVTLSVTDDIYSLDELSVCLAESTTNQDINTCSNYKSYHEYFSESNTMEYQFNCGGTCTRDGKTHYLTVFVKDGKGLETHKKFEYTFSTNTAPVISNLTVETRVESFTSTNNNSKNAIVDFDVSDDLDSLNKLTIEISSGSKVDTHTNVNNTNFEFYLGDSIKYDGSTKSIKVKVTDSEGSSSEQVFSNYKLYTNQAPSISTFEVIPREEICTNSNYCSGEEGNSKNALVSISVNDDLDSDDKIKVCISENPNTCSYPSGAANYSKYSTYKDKYVNYEVSGTYNGDTKRIYAYAVDSEGNVVSSPKVVEYKLYDNQPPKITEFSVISKPNSVPSDGNLQIVYTIEAGDDFTPLADLDFKLYVDNVLLKSGKLTNFSGNQELTLPGIYDGKSRQIKVVVSDAYDSTSSEVEYQVFKKDLPIVNAFIESKNSLCDNEILCPNSANNDYTAKYSLDVEYDDGSLDDIVACVSDTDSCAEGDYKSYNEFYANKEIDYTFTASDSAKPYDGSVKKLYFFVRDKNLEFTESNIVKYTAEYTIYDNNKPVVVNSPVIVPVKESGDDRNLAKIKYSIGVLDDLDSNLQISYCKRIGEAKVCTDPVPYVTEYTLDNNNFFMIDKYTGQEFTIFSIITDSYGESVESEDLTYKVYEDEAPGIKSVDGVYDVRYKKNGNIYTYDEAVSQLNIPTTTPEDQAAQMIANHMATFEVVYSNMRVSFIVYDPLDNYSYYVAKSSNSATPSYSTDKFSGDNKELHIINYTGNDFVPGKDDDDSTKFTLYVKDDSGNVSTKSFIFNEYSECLTYNEETMRYDYNFDSSKEYKDENGNTVSNNQKISLSRCGGKCYKDSTSNNQIFGYYDEILSYKDRYNSSRTCVVDVLENPNDPNSKIVTERPYKAYCDFKDCFYKNDNYVRKAIGTTKMHSEVPITYENYQDNYYYVLYESSYTDGGKSIELTPTPNKLPANAVDAGVFDYNSSQSNPYIRVSVNNS